MIRTTKLYWTLEKQAASSVRTDSRFKCWNENLLILKCILKFPQIQIKIRNKAQNFAKLVSLARTTWNWLIWDKILCVSYYVVSWKFLLFYITKTWIRCFNWMQFVATGNELENWTKPVQTVWIEKIWKNEQVTQMIGASQIANETEKASTNRQYV